jgi:hypothetical protein
MASNSPKVLLIADNPMGLSFLEARFNKWACEVHFALSCKAATAFVSHEPFDLVLSQFRLRDGSSYPLAGLLIGSNTTLVYSYPVETGSWWLPAVKNGQSCWGSLAMRPREFIVFLDDILKEIQLRQIANHELRDLIQSDGEIDVSPVEPVNVEVQVPTQSALLTVDPSERRRSPAASSHHASANSRRLRRRQNVLGRHVYTFDQCSRRASRFGGRGYARTEPFVDEPAELG